MLSTILAAFQSIPKLIDLISQIRDDIGRLTAAIQKQREDAWIASHRELIFKIVRAKTDAERFVMLHELVKLRDTLP